MEFANLDTKTPAEAGSFLHLRHPSLGHLLYNGDGCDKHNQWIDIKKPAEKVGVIVRGIESESVQNLAKSISANRMKNANGKRKGPGGEVNQTLEEEEQEATDFCVSMVINFVGINRDGKPLEANDENKRAFFGSSDDLIKQVADFAKNHRYVFTGAPSK